MARILASRKRAKDNVKKGCGGIVVCFSQEACSHKRLSRGEGCCDEPALFSRVSWKVEKGPTHAHVSSSWLFNVKERKFDGAMSLSIDPVIQSNISAQSNQLSSLVPLSLHQLIVIAACIQCNATASRAFACPRAR